jgi:Fibronectin type III domain
MLYDSPKTIILPQIKASYFTITLILLMKQNLLLILSIFCITSCKKTIDIIDNTSSTEIIVGSPDLHTFTITVSEITTTAASVEWNDAGDYQSDSISYTLILNGNYVEKSVKGNAYKLSGLQPATAYHLEIKAAKSDNQFVTTTADFTTDDGYIKFQKSYYENVVPYDIALAPNGSYVVCMYDAYPLNGGVRISKFDSSGNEVWKRVFHYNGTDSRIKSTNDGYIIMGSNFIFKINFEGEQVWYKTFQGTGTWFTSLSLTKNNEIIITGFENTVVAVLLFDANGNLKWRQRYGTSALNRGYDVIASPGNDGFYVIATKTIPLDGLFIGGTPVTTEQYWLLKIDSQGNLIWDKTFNTQGHAFPKKIFLQNGDLIIGGFSSSDRGDADMEVIRTDSNGNILKFSVVEPPGFYTRLNSVEPTSDGGYVICGAVSKGNSSTQLGLYKYNADDKLIWSKTYPFDFSYWTNSYSIKQTEDKGYIVPATKFQLYGKKSDLWLLKLNPSGSNQ